MTFYPRLKERLTSRPASEPLPQGEMHLDLLVKYLDAEHRATLLQIQNLQDHQEATFDLLWYIFIPRTLFYLPCPVSGEPRVAMLISSSLKTNVVGQKFWSLKLEYTDASGATESGSPAFGRASLNVSITEFKGTKKIINLSTYPFALHPSTERLARQLIERGRNWALLDGARHKRYDGTAYQCIEGLQTQRRRVKVGNYPAE
jgi:hypothetical protein